MGADAVHQSPAFVLGLLGSIISFMVYLAPVFYKRKSTEGFESIPYVVALFSAMLWMYYATQKNNENTLLIVNSVGCTIETAYIIIYMVYAPKRAKIFTLKMVLVMNVGVFGSVLLSTLFLTERPKRVAVLGWVCAGFSISALASRLSIMRLVIRTRSVEFMPLSLPFFLTLSAATWIPYGFLVEDLFVVLPNVLGFIFGIAEMGLYIIYKDGKKACLEPKLPEQAPDVNLNPMKSLEVHPSECKRESMEIYDKPTLESEFGRP
ncbi:bidirectional sugar transporter SWEET14-like isoform X2 [Tasmannia lanceolata]|uniref:bidirectional sugar transporter SWEET14-like isoform X2 n=1 Tax=Tasmannia lanceolata TaxID=3420 RepID=UPI004062AA7D